MPETGSERITGMTAKETLKTYFGYDSFRSGQESIIEAIMAGRDSLAIMPTGAGKSICYQVPALMLPGITLVISPLISLMQDQVKALNDAGIHAAFINSSLTEAQIGKALSRAAAGAYKIIYVAPERLESYGFMEFAGSVDISMVTVDEAHCISQWGQDFRPGYLKIVDFIRNLPGRPVVSAFTATATEEVKEDILCALQLLNPSVTVTGFDRENLYYSVENIRRKEDFVIDYIEKHSRESGIIYCATRKSVDNLFAVLYQKGVPVTRYHAGIDNETRKKNQEDFIYDRMPVMVATNAFGMGIDKPDVRIVIHIDMPDSPEAYFQEAGRAGRDGQKAYAVLLYAQSDKTTLNKRISDTFPDKEYIRKVYEDINYYFQMAMGDGMGCTFAFNLDEFCRNFKHFPVQADSALKILTRAGYLEYTDEQDNASRILFTMRRDELYRLHENDTDTEKLINIILRSYTGLFTDYACINEDSLVIRSGLTRQRIYEILLALTRKHIIHYIPRKKTPYIIYTRERQEKERLVLTREIYEDRKKSYTTRIKAMIEYATAGDKCRSRMLLRYFGEKNEHNCGQCDVCLNKHHSGIKQGEFQELETKIKQLLQANSMPVSELLNQLDSNREKAEKALSYLLSEEIIQLKNGILTL